MTLQSFRQFKAKLSSHLKHLACAQGTLCWHEVVIFSPTVPPDTTHTNYLWIALLLLSPSSWVRVLRTFHKNNPRSLGHKNSFFDIIFCPILFFFLLYRLTHLARTIPSSCTYWITQPGPCFSVSNFWSLGVAFNHFAITKCRGVSWLTQQAGTHQVKGTATHPAATHRGKLCRAQLVPSGQKKQSWIREFFTWPQWSQLPTPAGYLAALSQGLQSGRLHLNNNEDCI